MAKIQGLENYKSVEIQNIVLSHIDYLKKHFYLEDLDFSIQGIIPFGSRALGFPNRSSDLDIKIQYTGSAREDDLLNALNNKRTRLNVEGIKVDFYPEKISTNY